MVVNSRTVFGDALRSLRRKAIVENPELTIGDIVSQLGWKKPYLMDIEKGRAPAPADEKIKKLCKVLSIEDKFDYLRELALVSRNKVVIPMSNTNNQQLRTARMLEDSWEDMSEEQFMEIQKILEGT